MLLLIDFDFQFNKPTITHFAYISNGYLYASHDEYDIIGFTMVHEKGSVTVTVNPGKCVHIFTKRHRGYAIISKFNPTDEVMTFTFTSDLFYAYAEDPRVDDVLTFLVDTGPFGVPAVNMFKNYVPDNYMMGEYSGYAEMVNALAVTWSPGLAMGSQFSTEYNIELYDSMFNFNLL